MLVSTYERSTPEQRQQQTPTLHLTVHKGLFKWVNGLFGTTVRSSLCCSKSVRLMYVFPSDTLVSCDSTYEPIEIILMSSGSPQNYFQKTQLLFTRVILTLPKLGFSVHSRHNEKTHASDTWRLKTHIDVYVSSIARRHNHRWSSYWQPSLTFLVYIRDSFNELLKFLHDSLI
jgi:hypothetical protein